MNIQALHDAYVVRGKSLSEIAGDFRCSRQYIHKRLAALGIPRRTLADARRAALQKGKVTVQWEHAEGVETRRTLVKRNVNERFFERWSPEMAYVLGVIVTDGCLSRNSITVSQKEPELLLKIGALLGSDHPLAFRPQRGKAGAVYTLTIYSQMMFRTLLDLGVTPRKSRTLLFPGVPLLYLRHFIRGCWDGDGSIYFECNSSARARAHYVSGSYRFILGMANALAQLGIGDRITIHRTRTERPVWYVRVSLPTCSLIYRCLYDGVAPEQYLERKHAAFLRAHEFYITRETGRAASGTGARMMSGERWCRRSRQRTLQ